MSDRATGAGLYVHVPFCSAICPYCDFAVVTGGSEARQRYTNLLCKEVERAEFVDAQFDTIYFGGGTPSALSPAQLDQVISACRRTLDVANGSWISIEANPEDVTLDVLPAWRDLGVRTVSLGTQSFVDDELRQLGRRHTAAEARRSAELSLAAGFDIVSVDLIFGLPHQQPAALQHSIDATLALGVPHVSCYQLTVHEDTPFAQHKETGRLEELPEHAQGDLFEMVHAELEAGGVLAYEVSNFARGPESRSRHNQKYWRHQPYLGVGLGAHSFDGSQRWWNHRELVTYQEALEQNDSPIADREQLTDPQLALEFIMLALRTSDGLDLGQLQQRFGIDLAATERDALQLLVREQLAELSPPRLQLTRRGMAITDAIVDRLTGSLES